MSETSGLSETSRRAVVPLSLQCDNACVFCGQAGLDASRPTLEGAALEERLAALRAGGHDELTFVGGEPTRVDGLVQAVDEAKRAGFSAIGVQTNGSALAAHADALARAGLTDVHVSVHGARAEVHDFHTGRDGSFARLREGMAAVRRAGLTLVATTVLTRSSYRVLGEMEVLLSAASVSAWCVAVPIARGRAEDAFDWVTPRLALALPFALHALSRASERGIATFVWGAPLCLLGPYAARALESEARAFGDACHTCPARATCPGVEPRYLARFGGGELRARADAPRAWTDRERALARMFVGPGALAPASASADAPEEADDRRRLRVV